MSTIFNIKGQLPPGAKAISYSQFSLYDKCPHSWKLRYIDKHRLDQPSIHLIFGTAMHEVLQEFLRVTFEVSAVEADKLDLFGMLKNNMTKEYIKMKAGLTVDVEFTSKAEMVEFYNDGVEILDWFRKHRREYFPTKNHKLLGIEIPLIQPVLDGYNVYIQGFIDIVILDERDNTIFVYDFKTSTRGWGDKDKKDETKKSQVIIYKEYFSKQFDIPQDNIIVEFLILKRKVFEGQFTPKRVQRFAPASGKVIRKKVLTKLHEFVTKAFTPDGQYNTEAEHLAIAGDMDINCKYCKYKKEHTLCPPANRCYY